MDMDSKEKRNDRLIFVSKCILWSLFACLALVTILSGRHILSTGVIEYADSTSLNGKWTASAEQPKNASSCECTLPDNVTEGSALSLKQIPAGTKVYLDGELIYSDKGGKDDINAYLWVSLPDGSSGKTVTVVAPKVASADETTLLDVLNDDSAVGERAALQKELLNEGAYALAFGVMVLTLCAIILFLQAKLRKMHFNRKNGTMRTLTEFLLCSSFWVICDSQVLQCMFPRFGMVTMIGSVALLLLPLFFLRFMETLIHVKRMLSLNFLSLGLCIVMLAFYVAGVTTIYETIVSAHIIIMIILVSVTRELIEDRKRRGPDNPNGRIIYGCLAFFMSEIIGLSAFYVTGSIHRYAVVMCVGILVLMCFVMDSWFNLYIREIRKGAQSDAYRKLAYVDALTGMENRAAYMRDLELLDETKSYAFVMMDLNYLKTTNDNYGHDAGDRLIQLAADKIRSAFEGYGTSYRIGGDEFLVIMPDEGQRRADELIRTMRSEMAKVVTVDGIKVDVACGSSSTDEGVADFQELIHRADMRMYDDKSYMKTPRNGPAVQAR